MEAFGAEYNIAEAIAIKENRILQIIVLGWNDIGDEGAKWISEAIKEKTGLM
jgi:hypothetical protein